MLVTVTRDNGWKPFIEDCVAGYVVGHVSRRSATTKRTTIIVRRFISTTSDPQSCKQFSQVSKIDKFTIRLNADSRQTICTIQSDCQIDDILRVIQNLLKMQTNAHANLMNIQRNGLTRPCFGALHLHVDISSISIIEEDTLFPQGMASVTENHSSKLT